MFSFILFGGFHLTREYFLYYGEFEKILLPIQIIFEYDDFIFKPDNVAKYSRILIMLSKELGEPSVKMVMLSAYCDSVYSTTSIEIPLMSLLFLLKIPSISAHKRNAYMEIGSPCVQPLSG